MTIHMELSWTSREAYFAFFFLLFHTLSGHGVVLRRPRGSEERFWRRGSREAKRCAVDHKVEDSNGS